MIRIPLGNEVGIDQLYVVRKEDAEFQEHLRCREWINLVAPRAMGKSSLFDRSARELAPENICLVRTDISFELRDDQLQNDDPFWLFEGILGTSLRAVTKDSASRKRLSAVAKAIVVEQSLDSDGVRFFKLIEQVIPEITASWKVRSTTWVSDAEHHPAEVVECVVIGIDEIQLLGNLKCGSRFVSAMDALRSLLNESIYSRRVVFCFLGWQTFGSFTAESSIRVRRFVRTQALRDFPNNAETVTEFATAFRHPESIRETIQYALSQTGGHPLITCTAIEEIRRRIEIDHADVPTNQYLSIARKLLEEDHYYLRSLLQIYLEHPTQEIEASRERHAAVEAYRQLLLVGRIKCNALLGGVDVLLCAGLIRRVTTDVGECYEIRCPMFARWYDESWVDSLQKLGAIVRPIPGEKKTVCLIIVGGTVSMTRTEDQRSTRFATIEEMENLFSGSVRDELPQIEIVRFGSYDSINVHPTHWKSLIAIIAERLQQCNSDGQRTYAGIVVAHGTDTLAFTASAAAFSLNEILDRPIVFTGSQVPLDAFDSDAGHNLYTSCKVAEKGVLLPEVVIVFGRRILRGVQAVKRHDFEYEAFASPMTPELGNISETVELVASRIRPAKCKRQPSVSSDFAERILLIELMPGLEPTLYESALDLDLSGIILQTLGAGNVSDWSGFDFTSLVKRAWHEKTIPVLVTSKIPVDPRTYTRYERGVKAIDQGAVPAMNMTPAAAAAKFRWVLAKPGIAQELRRIRDSRIDEANARASIRNRIWDEMNDDIAGEIAIESSMGRESRIRASVKTPESQGVS